MVAGCGGSDELLSKEEYDEEAFAIVEGLGNEAAGLFSDLVIESTSQDECAEKAGRFHDLLEQIVEHVEDLRPPVEVEDLQRRFLVAARVSVAEIGRAVADVQNGQLSCGFDLNRRIYGLPSTQRAEQVVSEYHELGYLHFFLFGP